MLAVLFALASVAVACSSSPETPTAAPTSTTAPPVTTPTPTPGPPTPTPASTTPGPSGIPAELAAFLAEVDSKVAAIRGIPVADPVPYRFLNKADLNAYIREKITDPEVIEEIELSEAIYKLLGLIEPDAVLFDEYASLLDSQVLGAYDPEVEEFVVLQPGESFGPSQEFTYAHEYVHRLQDARFGLDAITESLEDNSDRSLAFSALVEGDATTVQQIYALQNFSLDQLSEILEDAQAAAGNGSDAPYILQRGLEFPYIEGASFVDRLKTMQGAGAVDEAFENPPDSTEQVMHMTKFASRELPVDAGLPESLFAADGPLGSGWEEVYEDVLGEFFVRTWLEAIGAGRGDASEAASGWGGDKLKLGVNGEGEYAVACKIVWDTPEMDAEQFFVLFTTIKAASPDFRALEIGPDVGVRAYQGPGGVIVVATFTDEVSGNFSAIAAAPSVEDAMSLVLEMAR